MDFLVEVFFEALLELARVVLRGAFRFAKAVTSNIKRWLAFASGRDRRGSGLLDRLPSFDTDL